MILNLYSDALPTVQEM